MKNFKALISSLAFLPMLDGPGQHADAGKQGRIHRGLPFSTAGRLLGWQALLDAGQHVSQVVLDLWTGGHRQISDPHVSIVPGQWREIDALITTPFFDTLCIHRCTLQFRIIVQGKSIFFL